jgi:DNA-binding response OmpR family regulator
MERSALQIVVADKNYNVREFLRREFIEAGYRVLTAKDGFDLVNTLRGSDKPDLVVMDLDIPFLSDFVTRELCKHQESGLPVILHSFADLDPNHPLIVRAYAVIEKSGNPEQLETIVLDILKSNSADFSKTFTGLDSKLNLIKRENSN